jgi:hypothetical protein
MNKEEIQKILAASSLGDRDAVDPLVAQALEEAKRDPALLSWFEREREFDRKFSRAFLGTPLPKGLKARLLSTLEVAMTRRLRRSRTVAWTVAGIALLIALVSSWYGFSQPASSVAHFRGEMVGFIKVTPSLELETSRLTRIKTWLSSAGAPASVSLPPGLEALEPVGCRVLFFRGHKVTLICFRRTQGSLVHLFVVDADIFAHLRSKPVLAPQGNWMTAAWKEDGRFYLLAAQGDEELLRRYLRQKS